MSYKTEQESFWSGEFGDDYVVRNNNSNIIASNIHLFSKVLERTTNINSIIEFGSNIGLNLIALQKILPNCSFLAIEINKKATEYLKDNIKCDIYNQSILDYKLNVKHDLVLVKGVLIHINPDELNIVYEKLYSSCQKYICIAEYYNPTPVEISYRGHKNKLFKRDFAGEILLKYKDLELVDYGFVYHKDNNFPQDDITWFLLEKK